jgi:hypothetical protein
MWEGDCLETGRRDAREGEPAQGAAHRHEDAVMNG